MKKKIYSIKHDSNARNDEKLLLVRRRYGMEGYGIYWAIVEMLREAKGYVLPADYTQIAWELHVAEDLIAHIIEDFDLFVVSEDGFYSQRLTDEMTKRDEISESKRKAGILGMKSRWSKSENKPLQDTQTEPILFPPSDTEKEPSKSPKKPQKQYSPEETQLHKRCKDCFSVLYKQHKDTEFYWSAKDMAAIVGILKKIQKQMNSDEQNNLEQLGTNFQAFIQMIYARADDWIVANISPSVINGKFNEIYTQLKNRTPNGNRQTKQNTGNARDNTDYLASLVADLQSSSN